jgi:hypothetical protein
MALHSIETQIIWPYLALHAQNVGFFFYEQKLIRNKMNIPDKIEYSSASKDDGSYK